jgi:hypothetical protein
MSTVPPPLPQKASNPQQGGENRVLPYETPGQSHPDPDTGVQRVFDTITGPNVRLKDNLIQLVSVGLGAAIGYAIATSLGGTSAGIIGAVLGMIGALLLSGLVIGVVRLLRK